MDLERGAWARMDKNAARKMVGANEQAPIVEVAGRMKA